MNTLTTVATTILCRVSFCECCKSTNRPHFDDVYLAYGSTHKDYHTYEAKKYVARADLGFTPHILQLESIVDTTVYYRYVCSMYGCDVQRKNRAGVYSYFIPEEKWKHGVMTKANWEALKNFKDTGYEL